MSIRLNPYIHFTPGTADKAIHLYERALGAKVESVMRYSDMPGSDFPSEQKGFVMHAEVRIGEGAIMLCDAMPDRLPPSEGNTQILLNFTDLSEMRETFKALAVGGHVVSALEDTFWGATFGIVTDAFGVRWMFNCAKKN